MKKKGGIRYVETHINPLKKDNEISALQIINHDITNHINAEKELKEIEEKFRQIAENIDEVFWIIDTKMNQIIYISPTYGKNMRP